MRRDVRDLVYRGVNKKVIIESFNNFKELKDVNSQRVEKWVESSKHDSYFTGCDSLEDAYDKLIYGWEDKDKIKDISKAVCKLNKTLNLERTGFRNDVVGFAPVVPNAIRGIPQSMINSVKVPKRAKVVRIVVNPSFSADTNIKSVLDWGAKVIAKINQIEMNGYRCRLEYCTDFISGNGDCKKYHILKVLIKSENQPLDIKRIMFPIAHAGMLRAIAFDWYEKLPEGVKISGYGKPLDKQPYDLKEIVEGICKEGDDGYYLHYGDNVESRFGGLVK